MKIKCDVCKTEYSMDNAPNGRVRCTVCGNVWAVPRANRRSGLMVFIASICALLAATIFAVVVIVTSRHDDPNKRPLIATITSIENINQDGKDALVVNGTITNRSDDIYGLPDLVIILHDANGAPIAHQKFMPTATLLDAGQSVGFSHTLTTNVSGVKKVSVELLESEKQGTK